MKPLTHCNRYVLHGLMMLPLDLWATPGALDTLRITKVQGDKRVDPAKLAAACSTMALNLIFLAFPYVAGARLVI